ncbi:hypothetical protein HGM15179_021670, partial [Zosterops borbonicus]
VLEAQVAVVATLGELVASVTTPHRDMQPFVSSEYLHAALRKFTWTLQDTLRLHGVTSLGYLSVTSLRQVLATLGATGEDTWADVIAVNRAWRESVGVVRESWAGAAVEARNLLGALNGRATCSVFDLIMNMHNSAAWEAAGDNLVYAAQQPPGALPTRRGQWTREVRSLLTHLRWACYKAERLTRELPDRILHIRFLLWRRKEMPLNVLEDWVASQARAKQLSKASARLAIDHLLRTVGDIHNLLLSPCGGPGGRSVAKRCQETIEDSPGPCKEQRTALSCGETRQLNDGNT